MSESFRRSPRPRTLGGVNECEQRDEFSARDWPEWNPGPEGAEGKRRARVGSVFGASPFLLFLIQPVTAAFSVGLPHWRTALLILDVVCYAVSYIVLLWYGPGLSHRNRIVAVLAATVLGGSVAVILLDPSGLTFLTYAIVLALVLWPLRAGWAFGIGIAVLQVVLGWVLMGDILWANTATLLILTVALGAFYRLINTTIMLRRARAEVRQLAVAEERARLARDLHDVLGHSLTTITMKSGLARRVLESDADREQAIAEVRDVEELARQALAEVRATVSGYRKASLAAELVAARSALRAAGIVPDLPHAVDDVAAPLRESFAYVLREAVTNVIRHSGASRCTVRLGESWIEVRDDGSGNVSTVEDGHYGGSGIAGLADRLSAVGAGLHTESPEDGGFLVRALREGDMRPEGNAVTTRLTGEPAVGSA